MKTKSPFFSLSFVLLFLHSLVAAEPSPLFRVEEAGKWGFINADGEMVIQPQCNDCHKQFSEGMTAVKLGDKWGYINEKNEMVIQAQFDSARSFHEGIALVRFGEPFKGKGKNAFIDRRGNIIPTPENSGIYDSFSEGLACAKDKKTGKRGFLNKQGKWEIPPHFLEAESFSEGLAAVRLDEQRAGFIDKQGNWIIELESAIPHPFYGFSEGLAPVRDLTTGSYGYIDKKGNYVIKPQFSHAGLFSEQRAVVGIIEEDEAGWPVSQYGVIDQAGEWIVAAEYEQVRTFQEGMAQVITEKGWGFINLEGEEVVPCDFALTEPFWNGLARVSVGTAYDDKTGWTGYINKMGEFVWRPVDYQDRDRARKAKEEEKPSIVLFHEGEIQKGLKVTCERNIPLTGEDAGQVTIQVSNYLEEQVLIHINDTDKLGYSLEPWGGGIRAGGGAIHFAPFEPVLYQLLAGVHHFEDGSIGIKPGNSLTMKREIDPHALNGGRSRGTVSVRISGFYRNDGASFSESIDLPIELVEEKNKPELQR